MASAIHAVLADQHQGIRQQVQCDGETAAFAVDGVQKAAKTNFPTSDVYGNVQYPALRLVTCGGPFDSNTGEYLDSIVVYAHLVGLASK